MKYSEDPGRQYHIGLTPGDIGHYVILPGDPKRVPKIAKYFDDAKQVGDTRDFVTYTGTLDGVKVSVTSTGIGGPSTAIALTELAKCGAHTFIRVGTCGGIQDDVLGGDIVIATSAVRQDGTSLEYAPASFPAAADFDVVDALRAAAIEEGYPIDGSFKKRDKGAKLAAKNPSCNGLTQLQKVYEKRLTNKQAASRGKRAHIGVVQSKDSFYGQHEPELMPVSEKLISDWNSYIKLGVLCSEMEGAALFTAGSFLRVRCGAVFLAVANQERDAAGYDNPVVHDTDGAIRTGVLAIRKLIQKDKEEI